LAFRDNKDKKPSWYIMGNLAISYVDCR